MNKLIIFIVKQVNDLKKKGVTELVKKIKIFTYLLAYSPVYFLAFLFYLIILMIKPLVLVRVGEIPCQNFGNLVSSTSLYYLKKKHKIDQPLKKFVDLIYLDGSKNISNNYLLNIWKKKMFILPSLFFKQIDQIINIFGSKEIFSIPVLSHNFEYDVDNLFEKYQSIKFSEKEESIGKQELKKFGLKENDKFICLAVRDGAYNEKIKYYGLNIYSSHNDFRNYDIKSFESAANALADRGYFVFRMGVKVSKPLVTNNKKIIDYANSNLRNEFLDIYLGAKCNFCISTSMGFDDLPYIFNRPMGIMGVPIGDLRTHSERFYLITKKHFDIKKNKNLSISEIFSRGLGFAYDQKIFAKKNIRLIDYNSDEIKNFCLEACDYFENKIAYDNQAEALQKKFKSLFASNLKKTDYRKQVKKPLKKIQGTIKSNFYGEFLKQNPDWLN